MLEILHLWQQLTLNTLFQQSGMTSHLKVLTCILTALQPAADEFRVQVTAWQDHQEKYNPEVTNLDTLSSRAAP